MSKKLTVHPTHILCLHLASKESKALPPTSVRASVCTVMEEGSYPLYFMNNSSAAKGICDVFKVEHLSKSRILAID